MHKNEGIEINKFGSPQGGTRLGEFNPTNVILIAFKSNNGFVVEGNWSTKRMVNFSFNSGGVVNSGAGLAKISTTSALTKLYY